MYFLIGLILATILALIIAGPIVIYTVDRARRDETPPKPPIENYLKALEYIAEEDIDLLKAIGLFIFIAFFACFVAWPLFLVVAIVLTALYFISINKPIRKKSTEILDNITSNFEDNAEDKNDEEDKDWFASY